LLVCVGLGVEVDVEASDAETGDVFDGVVEVDMEVVKVESRA
jgi:hypothetical protein